MGELRREAYAPAPCRRKCRVCDLPLPAKAEAIYERSTRTVRSVDHESADGDPSPSSEVIDPGTPGASARREFDDDSAREQRIRAKHPKLGGLIPALGDDPQSTQSLGRRRPWRGTGSGPQRTRLRTLRVLHDRRIPGSNANIDHIAVAATGVYAIDPKRYRGQRPLLKIVGGFIRPGSRNCSWAAGDPTKLVDGCSSRSTSFAGPRQSDPRPRRPVLRRRRLAIDRRLVHELARRGPLAQEAPSHAPSPRADGARQHPRGTPDARPQALPAA